MTEYLLKWPDLPDYSSAAQLPAQWAKPWKWANPKFTFERTDALPIAVTAEQHERLKRNLQSVAHVSAGALNHCLAAWKKGDVFTVYDASKRRGGKDEGAVRKRPPPKLIWPAGFSAKYMDPLMLWARDVGIRELSTEWMALERGAAHALDICKGRVLAGEAPRLPFSGDLPGGVSVRLGAGRQYAKPLGGEGLDLILGDIGTVRLAARPGGTEPRELCEYVEAAHWDRTWRIRLVYMRPRAGACPEAEGAPSVAPFAIAPAGFVAPVAAPEVSAPAPRAWTAGERLTLEAYIEREGGDVGRAEREFARYIHDLETSWLVGDTNYRAIALAHNAKLAANGDPEIAIHRIKSALDYESTRDLDRTFPLSERKAAAPA